jgi:hypothetical protein
MFLSAYAYAINNTTVTVTLKFGDCGGHADILNAYFSATRVIKIALQRRQPVDIFDLTCQLHNILRLWENQRVFLTLWRL